MALARSVRSGKASATMASATGLSIVAPPACSTRAAISHPELGASPQSSDPSPNTASPTRNTRRRPTRSAVDPASTRNPASTSV
jgi:hypothetical protein